MSESWSLISSLKVSWVFALKVEVWMYGYLFTDGLSKDKFGY